MRQDVSWAFARSPGERSFACALLAAFWDSGLFFPCPDSRVRGALVAPIGQDDQARGLQLGQHAPGRARRDSNRQPSDP
jgi:hypothetical protein